MEEKKIELFLEAQSGMEVWVKLDLEDVLDAIIDSGAFDDVINQLNEEEYDDYGKIGEYLYDNYDIEDEIEKRPGLKEYIENQFYYEIEEAEEDYKEDRREEARYRWEKE